MPQKLTPLEKRLAGAVRSFWTVRSTQAEQQGTAGSKDQGDRAAVTGGAHCDGFISLTHDLLVESGTPPSSIFRRRQEVVLPGWFRAAKQWDLLVVHKGELLAALEFKSHVGPSFGNNFNNRTEEALGNAVDVLAAYREGAFKPSPQPWLGWFMVVEDCGRSQLQLSINEPHFKAFPEFKDRSYIGRYAIFGEKLIRERLYGGACVVISPRERGVALGAFAEPSPELTFTRFITSLTAHVSAFVKLR